MKLSKGISDSVGVTCQLKYFIIAICFIQSKLVSPSYINTINILDGRISTFTSPKRSSR